KVSVWFPTAVERPNFDLSTLRGGNSIHLQCDRSLCKQPAVYGCASFHGDQRFGQGNSLKVRGCSKDYFTRDLPEYVLGLCVSAQHDSLAAANHKILRYLEDPHCVRAALETDICRYGYIRTPTV